MTDKPEQVKLRLPADLVARVNERASRNTISRNQWLTLVIARAVEASAQFDRATGQRF